MSHFTYLHGTVTFACKPDVEIWEVIDAFNNLEMIGVPRIAKLTGLDCQMTVRGREFTVRWTTLEL